MKNSLMILMFLLQSTFVLYRNCSPLKHFLNAATCPARSFTTDTILYATEKKLANSIFKILICGGISHPSIPNYRPLSPDACNKTKQNKTKCLRHQAEHQKPITVGISCKHSLLLLKSRHVIHQVNACEPTPQM